MKKGRSLYPYRVSSTKTSRKQHYLSRFYLTGFGRDGKIWVYDREREVCELRNPKTVARKHHYYSVGIDTFPRPKSPRPVIG